MPVAIKMLNVHFSSF